MGPIPIILSPLYSFFPPVGSFGQDKIDEIQLVLSSGCFYFFRIYFVGFFLLFKLFLLLLFPIVSFLNCFWGGQLLLQLLVDFLLLHRSAAYK